MAANYFFLLANIILLVVGQILFKFGLQKIGGLFWMKLATSHYILGGLMLYGVATLLWFAVLNRLPLSVAYPIQSLAYVFGIFAAWFVFGETISITKWAGAAIILMGVCLIAK